MILSALITLSVGLAAASKAVPSEFVIQNLVTDILADPVCTDALAGSEAIPQLMKNLAADYARSHDPTKLEALTEAILCHFVFQEPPECGPLAKLTDDKLSGDAVSQILSIVEADIPLPSAMEVDENFVESLFPEPCHSTIKDSITRIAASGFEATLQEVNEVAMGTGISEREKREITGINEETLNHLRDFVKLLLIEFTKPENLRCAIYVRKIVPEDLWKMTGEARMNPENIDDFLVAARKFLQERRRRSFPTSHLRQMDRILMLRKLEEHINPELYEKCENVVDFVLAEMDIELD